MTEILAGPQPWSTAPAPPTPPGVFTHADVWSPSSFWRKGLPTNATLHPDTDLFRQDLCLQMGLDPATPYAQNAPNQVAGSVPGQAWFSTGTGGVPIIVVGPNQPLVPVASGFAIDGGIWPANLDWHNVMMKGIPIPPDAQVDSSSDKSLVIWQPSTRRVWELYYAAHTPGVYDGHNGGTAGAYEWRAAGGGLIVNPETRNGTYIERAPNEHRSWGHTATGLPLYGGIITPEEWAAKKIEHPLHLTVGRAAKFYLSPAHRTDGWSDGAIPEGARVRLPATTTFDYLDLRIELNQGIKAIGDALRDYGALVTDKTGNGVALRFLNTINAYPGPAYDFTREDGQTNWPHYYMKALPWHRAQVVDPALSPDDL